MSPSTSTSTSASTGSSTSTHPGGARPSGRHPVSIGHLVMGIAFVGLVGVWALIQGDVVEGGDIRWLFPVPWVLAGTAGLVATTITGRDRWATRQTGWVAPAASEHDAPVRPADLRPDHDHTEEIR